MSPLPRLAMQCACLLAAARLAGVAVKKLGQPSVVGELAAGLALAPLVGGALFPEGGQGPLSAVSRILLALFLFDSGLETPAAPLKRLARSALAVSIAGIVVPFVFGWALGLACPESLSGVAEHRRLFALFMGTALAITAVPVIAAILRDLRLLSKDFGALVMRAAVIDDVVGWTLLACCAGLAGSAKGPRWWAAASSAGPFLVGLAVGAWPRARAALEPAGRIIRFLSPVFFAYAGLGVAWTAFSRPIWPLAFLAAACAGKAGGCYVGARAAGVEHRAASAVAAAMNARGAMELAAASIGRALGILNSEAYTIVVFVAVSTTVMAPPLLRRWAGAGYLRAR